MSLVTPSRLLLFALGIGFGVAYIAVPTLLQSVKDAARSPAPEPPAPKQRLQQDSENALEIETLRTLADGYSYDLRTSAIRIVASRTVRSRAKYYLLEDLACRNYERREQAINALTLLLGLPALKNGYKKQFNDAKGMKAIVRALVNVLPQHERQLGSDSESSEAQPQSSTTEKYQLRPSPIRPLHRPPQERALLEILQALFPYSTSMEHALKAGLVTRWLANYPFPCTLPQYASTTGKFKRSQITHLLQRSIWGEDDLAMSSIVQEVMHYPEGRKQMRQVGLAASIYKENVNVDLRHVHSQGPWGWGDADSQDDSDDSDDDDSNDDVRMVNGEDTAGFIPLAVPAPHPRPFSAWEEPSGRPTTRAGARLRSAERSVEEEHLRRRHREAIVVAERGAPLSADNILLGREHREDLPARRISNDDEDAVGAELNRDFNGPSGLSEDTETSAPSAAREEVADEEDDEARDSWMIFGVQQILGEVLASQREREVDH